MVPIVTGGSYTHFPKNDEESERIAIFQFDASARPDIADLARVTAIDGIQTRQRDITTIYFLGKGEEIPGMTAVINITDPVECFFSFFISWLEYRDAFYAMAESGIMYLTTGEIRDKISPGKFIGMTVLANEIDEMIQIWESI
jgi:hypothetical protein